LLYIPKKDINQETFATIFQTIGNTAKFLEQLHAYGHDKVLSDNILERLHSSREKIKKDQLLPYITGLMIWGGEQKQCEKVEQMCFQLLSKFPDFELRVEVLSEALAQSAAPGMLEQFLKRAQLETSGKYRLFDDESRGRFLKKIVEWLSSHCSDESIWVHEKSFLLLYWWGRADESGKLFAQAIMKQREWFFVFAKQLIETCAPHYLSDTKNAVKAAFTALSDTDFVNKWFELLIPNAADVVPLMVGPFTGIEIKLLKALQVLVLPKSQEQLQ
jgi:truncated hemoglobin YjbI